MNRSQSFEFAAKSVEDAVDEGLRQLGLSRDQIDVEVIEEGSRGILGIGATDALVRIKPLTEPEGDEAQTEEGPAVSEAMASESEEGTVDHAVHADHADHDAPSAEADLRSSEDGEAEEEEADAVQVEPGDQAEGDAELEDLAYDLLSQMLQKLDIEAEIELSWLDDQDDGESPLNLNVVGEDLGILIGRNGETLASIQYLIRLMVNQELHRWKNIVIDVDGYKQRRAEQLSQLAHRLAEQVVSSGRPASLEPMPASERRLVHIALRDHEQVYTASIGEDSRRKVQILPK
ncbi:MAG: Jag N-terminal domain-containing protein [Caldilineaceae bacterium]|nr:Jag N-terminal domain-containing protein [Caldilineaceae bacterium]